MRVRGTVPLMVALAAGLALPSAAQAAPQSFADPFDTGYGAADVGGSLVDVRGDRVAWVSLIAPRPPAGWGGCVPIVPGVPTCLPADMSVRWLIDADRSRRTGSPADRGADARVTLVPGAGTTVGETARYDARSGRWVAGAPPQVAVQPDRVGWAARLADLGLGRGARARVWIESVYGSFTGLGQQTAYLDRAPDAGGYLVRVPGRAPRPPAACRRLAQRANALGARIRRTSATPAKRALQRRRAAAQRALRSRCAAWTGARVARSARPGCRTVTRLQLVLTGTGSRARYVLRPRVTVVCR